MTTLAWSDLVVHLCQSAPALVVLEATGGFEITVAAALSGAKLPIAVVKPRWQAACASLEDLKEPQPDAISPSAEAWTEYPVRFAEMVA